MATELLPETIIEIGKMFLYLQTLGIIIIFWITFNIISLIVNRKKRKALYAIRNDLKRIETKLDKLIKKK